MMSNSPDPVQDSNYQNRYSSSHSSAIQHQSKQHRLSDSASYALTTLIGRKVQVVTKNGSIYEGLFSAFQLLDKSDFTILLEYVKERPREKKGLQSEIQRALQINHTNINVILDIEKKAGKEYELAKIRCDRVAKAKHSRSKKEKVKAPSQHSTRRPGPQADAGNINAQHSTRRPQADAGNINALNLEPAPSLIALWRHMTTREVDHVVMNNSNFEREEDKLRFKNSLAYISHKTDRIIGKKCTRTAMFDFDNLWFV